MIRTEPDTFATMTDLNGRVRFHFDERISEQVPEGNFAAAVTVSPLTGEVRASHGRSTVTVWLEGGFRPGLVYRVTLLPVVADLFGNRLPEAFEVVFSTGGDTPATATLAGEVWDRVSGRTVNGAMVRAVGADSLVHVARTDDQGVFAFRYLPTGDFVLTGFQDQDRDGAAGASESQGSVPASLAAGDTLVLDIPLLAPDTTAAVAGAGRALDSLTIVVEFDDFLDPAASSDQISVELTREGGQAPLVARLFHEEAYQEYVEQIADSFARIDSIAAAEAAAAGSLVEPDSATDSVTVAVPDSVDAGPAAEPRPIPPRLAGAPAPQSGASARTRPGRRIVGRLDGPLDSGVEYQLRVTAVVNVNGLPGGGGEVTLTYEPPPPDTTQQGGGDAAGNGGANGDGNAAVGDSAAATDTLRLRP